MPSIFQTQTPGEGGFNWLNAYGSAFPVGGSGQTTGLIATLVATPYNGSEGTVGGSTLSGTGIQHVTITPASGPGTYQFAHGLTYTPEIAWAILRGGDGVTPSNYSAFVLGDTNATFVALNLSANGTWDCYYS